MSPAQQRATLPSWRNEPHALVFILPMMTRARPLGTSRHVVGVKARELLRTGAEIRHHPHPPPVSNPLLWNRTVAGNRFSSLCVYILTLRGVPSDFESVIGRRRSPLLSPGLPPVVVLFLSRRLGPFVNGRRTCGVAQSRLADAQVPFWTPGRGRDLHMLVCFGYHWKRT